MAVTADGWLDWAARDLGPADKVYSVPNSVDFYVPHSAVGYFPGWRWRLFSTERRPDGKYTTFAAVSVQGWVSYDGSVVQHYPLTTSCWASGSRVANTRGVAFETEGGAPGNVTEALTVAQIGSHVRILKDIATWKGVDVGYWRRPVNDEDLGATLYEHNECGRFGSAPTACPSDRIPWDIIAIALRADGELTPPVFVQEPGSSPVRRYLWTGSHLHWMKSAEVRQEMADFLGIDSTPAQINETTWARLSTV